MNPFPFDVVVDDDGICWWIWTFITADMVVVKGSRIIASHVDINGGTGQWLLFCRISSRRLVPFTYGAGNSFSDLSPLTG